MTRNATLAAMIAALVATPALAVTTDGGPAPAQASPPAAAPATPPVKPEDQIVCKRVDVSGTRIQLPKKCMTRKDWNALAGRGKDDIESIIRSSLTVNHPGGT